VIAVTHLPSIAAAADRHLLVSKSQREARTTIALVEKEERVREIAAMIGGEPVTAAALAEARDLLERGRRRQAARARRPVSEARRA
jgi:DNA repair protein RecN (Recombination protein N)